MKNFRHFCPPFTRLAGGEAFLARVGARPPGLGDRIGSHARHIRAKIGSNVLEKAEKKIILDLPATCNGLDQGNLFWTQGIEDDLHIGGLHARFIIIKQGVVGVVRRREEGNIFPGQFHDLFKMRLKDREIGLRSCLDPGIEKLVRSVGTYLLNYIQQHICPRFTLERYLREGVTVSTLAGE